MKDSLFKNVEKKTNINKDTIMSLAKKLQSSSFKDEKVLNEVIDELSSLTGKNIDDSKRDKIIKAIKNGCSLIYLIPSVTILLFSNWDISITSAIIPHAAKA